MDYFKLFLALRFVMAYIVMFHLPFPLTVKILLIMFFDNLDGRLPKNLKIHDYDHTLTKEYQIHDKIADLGGYCVVLYYLYKKEILNKEKIIVLSSLLVYRIIGDIIFFKEKNRKILFYFPNVFEKIALLFAILYDTQSTLHNDYIVLIAVFIGMFKTYHEYFLHYSDDNHAGFKPYFSKFLKGKVPIGEFLKTFKKKYMY